MNIQNTLDLSLASVYDMIVDKDRSLASIINCTYYSGSTEVPFNFTSYTAATLTVKNDKGTILIVFNTTDGSIVLGTTSFQLVKTAAEMNVVRAGVYDYDMFITSPALPKRAFLRGKITFVQNISN